VSEDELSKAHFRPILVDLLSFLGRVPA